jgi:hypothetical protein
VTAVTAVVSIAFFAAAVVLLRIPAVAAGALATGKGAIATLQAATDDRTRERAMQQASSRLFGGMASMLARTALAVGLALLPVAGAMAAGVAAPADVLAFVSRWDVDAAALALTGAYVAGTRWWTTH